MDDGRKAIVAQKVLTVLSDDVDGGKASETVTFGLDGVRYQIDLNTRNATKLRKSLAPFIAAGRRVGGRTGRAASPAQPARARVPATVTRSHPIDPAAVRAWAAAHRIKVSPRGRVPASVIEQFRAAGH